MILLWVVLIGLIAWAIGRLFPPRAPTEPPGESKETPSEILDRRLALGEIDTDEYARLRDALISARGGGGERR